MIFLTTMTILTNKMHKDYFKILIYYDTILSICHTFRG